MAEDLVPPVEPGRVGAQQPLHARDQIGLRRFHNQMKMVAHQTPGMHLPAGLAASLARRLREPSPVRLIPHDVLAPVPAVHHMINRAGIFQPELARHTSIPYLTCHYMSIFSPDPFTLWERGTQAPDEQQWQMLSNLLSFDSGVNL